MSGLVDPLEPLRPYVDNPFPPLTTPYVAGVLGDHPSTYSRSPAMWNAAFAALALPATYLPFDVAPERVDGFLAACRETPALLGFNVTVPYKEWAAVHLSVMNDVARVAAAVNTILRTPEGNLVGANTDGVAALAVLQQELGFGSSSRESRLLLLGAGGAARAVGAAAATVPGVEIIVAARRPDRAAGAIEAMARAGRRAAAIDEGALDQILPEVDLIVNATPVGMSGPLSTGTGVTWLEPFSALAPARPPTIVAPERTGDRTVPPGEWWKTVWPDITANLELSLRRALRLPTDARMLDLVYAPAEPVTVKHMRWTGHEARSGDRVLLLQAVEAFLMIMRPLLAEPAEGFRPAVSGAMAAALARTIRDES